MKTKQKQQPQKDKSIKAPVGTRAQGQKHENNLPRSYVPKIKTHDSFTHKKKNK